MSEKSGAGNEKKKAGGSKVEKVAEVRGRMHYVADRINAISEEVFSLAHEKHAIDEANKKAASFYKNNYCQAAAAEADADFTGDLPPQWPFDDDEEENVHFSIPPVFSYDYEECPGDIAIVLYFALHPSIDPTAPACLTDNEKKEIFQLCKKIAAFYDENEGKDSFKDKNGDTDFLNIADSFIEAEIKSALEGQTIRTISKRVNALGYPVDKVNAIVWNFLNAPEGQLSFSTEKSGSSKEATVVYSINFDELEKDDSLKITRRLTPYDKRAYIAVSALWDSGNRIISIKQIYTAMGYGGNPSARDIQKISDFLTKAGGARIYINNELETSVNKKYDRFLYDGPLLPFERVRGYINNALCDAAIHLFRVPPMISFAKSRRQITTIPRKLLESPVSKTDENLRMDDYLIERIAHMKKDPKNPRKILYSTLYTGCGITQSKQRKRAPEKIERYLKHYETCKFINGFSMGNDSVTISL